MHLVSDFGAKNGKDIIRGNDFVSLKLSDGEAFGHANLALVKRVSCNHISRSELLLVQIFKLRLSVPSWEKSYRRWNSFLIVDGVDVGFDLSVVDEWHPRLEALLNQLLLFLDLGEMARIKEIMLVRVKVCIALLVLQTSSLRHDGDIKVTTHCDS